MGGKNFHEPSVPRMAKPGKSRSELHTGPVRGYCFGGYDGGGYFFDDDPPPGVLCPACDSVLDASYWPGASALNTTKDVCSTYDNMTVVTERFVEACHARSIPGVTFHRFTAGRTRHYYFVEAPRVLECDLRGRTRFEDPCEACGQYASIVGGVPPFLAGSGPVPPGFSRTDTAFGSGRARRPWLVIDAQTAEYFDSLRFRGIHLMPILPSDEPAT
jgi:hypothetical protein